MGSGHALESINRLKNNRSLIKIHRARYSDLKKAVSNIHAKYHVFVDRSKLTELELKRYKQKVKQKIVRDRQKTFVISIFITILIGGFIYLTSVFLFNYFTKL